MKIGLVDCDSHNFPNLPLMKISSYHKKKGDIVEFALPGKRYDEIYVSKVFTESKEPELPECSIIHRGGSGYDLENKLPYVIEHSYPDYGLYSELTADTAYGFLTRGCPRKNHSFCITPQKDGCISRKAADLSEFWNGQKSIVLLDQNLLACSERKSLLCQLEQSGAWVDFTGGLDIRFINEDVIEHFRRMKVKEYHFAWDDPKEDLRDNFLRFRQSGLIEKREARVYVLANFWSNTEEDMMRIETLRDMGYFPYIMIYDKQKYVDSHGRWLPDVAERFGKEQLRHFKVCQHLQRWCGAAPIWRRCPDFSEYEPYRKWKEKGMPVPVKI